MRQHARTQPEARRPQAPVDRPGAPAPRLVDTDPEDPSFALADGAEGDAALDDGTVPADDEAEAQGDEQDTGDLYGVHTPHAGDPDLADAGTTEGFEGAEEGESFMEALAGHAAESGPAPEEEVVIIDDSDPDRGHSSTESGDRPVADKGSGGPGGL